MAIYDHIYGHIWPLLSPAKLAWRTRAPFDTPPKLGYAEFRGGSFYDGPEAIRVKIRFFRGREKRIGRKLAETGSRLDSCGSRELNRRQGRPGEGQGGPNKGHLDPKIGQHLRTTTKIQTDLQHKYAFACSCDVLFSVPKGSRKLQIYVLLRKN